MNLCNFLYEVGNTGLINYSDDVYATDYLVNWFRTSTV